MEFRIEKKDSFQIMGLSGYDGPEVVPGQHLTPLWRTFVEDYHPRLWNNGDSYYTAPFWNVCAYDFRPDWLSDFRDLQSIEGKTKQS